MGRAARLLAGPAPKYGCGEAIEELGASRRATFLLLFKIDSLSIDLACRKDTSKQNSERTCSRLSIARFANGPKRSMGHVLGAEKGIFLIRGVDAAICHGGCAG